MCQKPWFHNAGLLALRLALGAVFIYHGYGKLMDIAMTTGFFDMVGIPLPGFFAWVVALVEFLGGLALILGLYVRTVGLVLAFTMLIALITVHLGSPWGAAELAIIGLGGSLGVAGAGAGKWRVLRNQCVCGAKGCDTCEQGHHTH